MTKVVVGLGVFLGLLAYLGLWFDVVPEQREHEDRLDALETQIAEVGVQP